MGERAREKREKEGREREREKPISASEKRHINWTFFFSTVTTVIGKPDVILKAVEQNHGARHFGEVIQSSAISA